MDIDKVAGQMRDAYSPVGRQVDDEDELYQPPVDSRPASSLIASRPLSEYSCRPDDDDNRAPSALSAASPSRTMSPTCVII